MNQEFKYDKDFLSKEEADALFALAQSLPRERPVNKLSGFKNRLRRLQMPCYSATPNWRGSENEKTNQWMMALDEAPAEVKSLAEKLSTLAGKPMNYFSFVGYENENDHINWHQHGEDKCRMRGCSSFRSERSACSAFAICAMNATSATTATSKCAPG